MACTIDHLAADHHATVLRDFQDAQGVPHRAGETGFIRRIEMQWPEGWVVIEWERDGRPERMAFSTTAREGPGIGRMREYFECGPYAPEPVPGRHWVPELQALVVEMPDPPPDPGPFVHVAPRTSGAAWEALDRVVALAAHHRFDEATDQLSAIGDALHETEVATALGRHAQSLVFRADPRAYEWLRDQAIRHWYQWGAQATSGGDGTARMREIGPAMAQFRTLDQVLRRRQGGSPTA